MKAYVVYLCYVAEFSLERGPSALPIVSRRYVKMAAMYTDYRPGIKRGEKNTTQVNATATRLAIFCFRLQSFRRAILTRYCTALGVTGVQGVCGLLPAH